VNQEDLNKAYKKKSKTLHPDKVKQKFVAEKSTKKGKKGSKPGVHVSKGPTQAQINAAHKAASDRFSRLGLVNSILKGPGRERYDHFLSNGFPKWKGTGYYYARFRPGLGSVIAGLFIFVGGGGHYLALYMSWKRQKEFVGRYVKYARHSAWGDNLDIPGLDRLGTATPPVAADSDAEVERIPQNRKERRMMEKAERKEKPEKKPKGVKAAKVSPAATPPVGATGRKKRVVAENGKILVVDSVGNVYLEQKNEDGEMQEFLLDVRIPLPSTGFD
jgi:curved DNA-binding protein CbpA